MDKIRSCLLICIFIFSCCLFSSCEEPKRELTQNEKIVNQIADAASHSDAIELYNFFTFEWDTVIMPRYRSESVEELMGKHYDLKKDVDESSFDESLYDSIIFFKDKELVYEFYYLESSQISFGWYDYIINSDDCEFSVRKDEYRYSFMHIKNR